MTMEMFVIEFRKSQNEGKKMFRFILFLLCFHIVSFSFLIFVILTRRKELKAKIEYFRRHFTNPKDSCLSVVIVKTQAVLLTTTLTEGEVSNTCNRLRH